MEDLELLTPDHRQYCINEFKNLPSLRPSKKKETKSNEQNKNARDSAVLVPICRLPDGSISLLYTKRSPLLRAHAGEVSFPGGRCESGETIVETAIRETTEELGIKSDKIDVWDKLRPVTDKKGTSNITPVVAEIKGIFSLESLKLNSSEVSFAFVKTIKELSDPKIRGYTQFRIPNSPGYSLPVYKTEPYRIWGMTAIITYQFLNVLLKRRGYTHKIYFQSPIK